MNNIPKDKNIPKDNDSTNTLHGIPSIPRDPSSSSDTSAPSISNDSSIDEEVGNKECENAMVVTGVAIGMITASVCIIASEQSLLGPNATTSTASRALQEEAIENAILDPTNTESNIVDEGNQHTVESTMRDEEEKTTK